MQTDSTKPTSAPELSTTITVTDEFGVVKNVKITVKKAPTAKTFKASVSKKIIKVGKKFTLKPKFKSGYYSNSIAYTSNKKAIATVSKKGVVTAKKKGKAVNTVKTFNGKKVKVTITVKYIAVHIKIAGAGVPAILLSKGGFI